MTRIEVNCGMKPETISGRARQATFKAKAMLSGALIVPSVVRTVIVTGLLFLVSPLLGGAMSPCHRGQLGSVIFFGVLLVGGVKRASKVSGGCETLEVFKGEH